MPGTYSSGLRGRGDVAQRNGGGPHATGRDAGHPAPNRGQYGKYDVAAEPVAGACFTFERATKVQCVAGIKYAVPESSAERTYWTRYIAEAFRMAAGLPSPAPVLPLLQAIAEAVPPTLSPEALEDVLKIMTVEYAQLQHWTNPDLSMRDPEKSFSYVPPSSWENYKAPNAADPSKPKCMAQAPQTEGGRHYLVANVRSWPWTCTLTGSVELGVTFCKDMNGEDVVLGEIEYGWSMKCARRSKAHRYQGGENEQDWVIMISVGEINPSTNRLVIWKTRPAAAPHAALKEIALNDKRLRESLFWQHNRGGNHWPAWNDPSPVDEILLDTELVPSTVSVRFQLEQRENHMAYAFTPPKATEPIWTSVCDFILLKMEGIYQFVEEEAGMGFIKIISRRIIDENGSGVYLLKTADLSLIHI